MDKVIETIKEKTKVKWYVMIAYKQETEAEKVLSSEDGLEYYIAKHYIIQNFHGKKKQRLVPVIPNIIFVHASQVQIVKFKEKFNFIKFATWQTGEGLEYLVVRDNHMSDFIRVSESNEKSLTFYKPEEINLKKGEMVRVHGGKFDGIEGTFVRIKGKRSRQLVVLIPRLLAASIEVEPDLIERI